MIGKLRKKIKELELKKEMILKDISNDTNKLFDNYGELKKIDGALEVLRDIFKEEIALAK